MVSHLWIGNQWLQFLATLVSNQPARSAAGWLGSLPRRSAPGSRRFSPRSRGPAWKSRPVSPPLQGTGPRSRTLSPRARGPTLRPGLSAPRPHPAGPRSGRFPGRGKRSGSRGRRFSPGYSLAPEPQETPERAALLVIKSLRMTREGGSCPRRRIPGRGE